MMSSAHDLPQQIGVRRTRSGAHQDPKSLPVQDPPHLIRKFDLADIPESQATGLLEFPVA